MTTKEETMAKLTKKQKATAAIVDSHKFYDVDEAVDRKSTRLNSSHT